MTGPTVDRDTWMRLVNLVGDRHDEAQVCADAGAYIAAVVMLGSAVEGALLVTACRLEADLQKRKLWPRGDPLGWGFDKLLKLGLAAGWFTAVAPGQLLLLDDSELGDAVSWLKQARNLIHPGAFVRDLPDGANLGQIGFENAYKVLQAVFDATVDASEMFGS